MPMRKRILSGCHITDFQMRLYMSLRRTETTRVAAVEVGFRAASADRIEQNPRLPSQKKAPRGRRRPDPLAAVWDSEVVPLLTSLPGLRPIAVFQEIRHRRPEIGVGTRSTQRRRAGCHLPARASAGPVGTVRLHPNARSRRQHRRRAARSPALSFSTDPLGLGARACDPRRRKLCRLGRGVAERIVGARPSALAAPRGISTATRGMR
jgi:hypothetical protein